MGFVFCKLATPGGFMPGALNSNLKRWGSEGRQLFYASAEGKASFKNFLEKNRDDLRIVLKKIKEMKIDKI